MADEARKLLIVEDDRGLQKQLKWCFDGYDVVFAEDRESALGELRRHEPAVVLQDLGLPPDPEGVSEGFKTLQEILKSRPATKVIVVTGNETRDNALKAVGFGAYDFYQKPVDVDVLQLLVNRAFTLFELEAENRRLAHEEARSPLAGVIAVSSQMQELCRKVEKVAAVDVTTLLLGESGTGKELFAKALHGLSPRAEHRFIAINCAAIPENLLESELFGYEKGAYTGAHKQTIGKIELADKGTLLLDEIGDMPPALQAKLLRFLQERTVERIGGRKEIPVDVRVVCATNQDLQQLISEGGFREDLYYRISEVTLKIPPLRERAGCRVVLARHFLHVHAKAMNKSLRGLSDDAVDAVQRHAWPGNVRELENRIKGAVAISDGPMVSAEDLGLDGEGMQRNLPTLREVREDAERRAMVDALAAADGNVSRAAKLLGVSRPTVYDMLQRLEITVPATSGEAEIG
ncbi:PEP-CTERM-box response regulator transcription factor [Wenzhouxiangella sp. XN24]|uniref:PEP-CTERM-box response regulator transcription factor n=1 Tax=Wenzhouxiangella sp. XN24 TaxID=2713569 RepID=UPI0013ED26EE|nr:PEP-CTERM-box response regulator transcription factor [Wenzhouxiangella sp. XN24]NGX17073.1 PEP-CTERM-box response regulator transcription factor [Wenzhouxiangella sp. XN24]